MEEMERELISDLSDRGLNNPETHFGRKSDDSEALFSVNSSQDYWQNKIELRKNRTRTVRARNEINNDKLKQYALQRQQLARCDDLEKKIEQLKRTHDVELRLMRKVARKTGVDFFK